MSAPINCRQLPTNRDEDARQVAAYALRTDMPELGTLDRPGPIGAPACAGGRTGRVVLSAGRAARTFKRRFRKATGYAPIEYVQTLRIEEAKQMLETTPEPTDAVGANIGYEDPASFRRILKRLTGITPAR